MTIGRTAYVIVTDLPLTGCEASCLHCGERFRLETATLAMTIGDETIGYFCWRCLSARARTQLAAAERGVTR